MEEPIDVRFILESQGRPKEVVTKSLETLVDALKKAKNVDVYETKYSDVEAKEHGLFSGLVDVGLKCDSFETLTVLTLKLGPSAVIVLGPDKIEVTNRDIQNLLNDIATLLHEFAQANLNLKVHNVLLQEHKQKGNPPTAGASVSNAKITIGNRDDDDGSPEAS
jgi:hypothetical protein